MAYPERRLEPAVPFGPSGRRLRWLLAACLFWLALFPASGRGAPPSTASGDLEQSLQDALRSETETLARLEAQEAEARRDGKALAGELGAFRIQLSTYTTLGGMPSVGAEVLERALADQRRSIEAVRARLEALQPRREALQRQRQQTAGKLALNETQLAELQAIARQGASGDRWLETLRKVIGVERKILKVVGAVDALYAEQIERLQAVATDLRDSARVLADTIEQARRRAVFRRGESPLARLDRGGLVNEAERLRRMGERLRDAAFWRNQLSLDRARRAGNVVTFLLLGGGMLFLLVRLRAICRRGLAAADAAPWRRALLTLVTRSVVPFGLLAFLSLYPSVRVGPAGSLLVGALLTFAWVWLLSGWLRIVLSIPLPRLSTTDAWPAAVHGGRRLTTLIRGYAAAALFLRWALDAHSVLVALSRLAFELVLLVWLVAFWRRLRRTWPPAATGGGDGDGRTVFLRAAVPVSYGIVLGGPVLDLAGYGTLALYWFNAWGLTLAGAIWAALGFQTLRELEGRPAPAEDEAPAVEGTAVSGRAWRWALLRLAWLGWGLALVAFLLLAWGGRQSLATGVGRVLTHPFQVGGMTLRLSGALAGVLVLFVTHLTVRLWRHLLQGRILVRSGITTGLRDSITTISVYLIWAVGILAALHTFGISTTSLTVAFGALGIGLGFGLQNIFNNFISGLILLFERPIQVGDDIEINGVWAKVTRINVRSTVVQTYDNASLIIPNSDFISSQVVNWSHKDAYVRRNIDVGVAYGSDTERVRRTLLEVAAGLGHVRRHPAPDVLFTDFGDSALVFRLRLWTDIDHMLQVDTAARFEIDRRFREQGIEIAFPQHDVHIRSIRDTLPVVSPADRAGPAVGGLKSDGDR